MNYQKGDRVQLVPGPHKQDKLYAENMGTGTVVLVNMRVRVKWDNITQPRNYKPENLMRAL